MTVIFRSITFDQKPLQFNCPFARFWTIKIVFIEKQTITFMFVHPSFESVNITYTMINNPIAIPKYIIDCIVRPC